MKSIILTLSIILGVATVAALVLPDLAFACNAGDPGCN
jgi:hypothetical protein